MAKKAAVAEKSQKLTRAEVNRELELIRQQSPNGLLHPEAVWKAARKSNHPLHGYFTWDVQKAAEEYWSMQARALIRSVKVSNPEDAFRAPSPAYVALHKDRSTGGGYRPTEDVVSDEELKEALLETAQAELRGWMARYRTLTGLIDMDAVAQAAGMETSGSYQME